MQTYRVTIGDDGRVTLPGTHPGETVTVQITETTSETRPLTLATARTVEERESIIAEIERAVTESRRAAGDDDDEQLSLTHGDLLYDEYGLPK